MLMFLAVLLYFACFVVVVVVVWSCYCVLVELCFVNGVVVVGVRCFFSCSDLQ